MSEDCGIEDFRPLFPPGKHVTAVENTRLRSLEHRHRRKYPPVSPWEKLKEMGVVPKDFDVQAFCKAQGFVEAEVQAVVNGEVRHLSHHLCFALALTTSRSYDFFLELSDKDQCDSAKYNSL